MPRSNKPLAVVCLLLFLLSAAFHLLSAAKGHPHFRDQHFGPAQLIASGETDWLHPVIPGFTANDSPVVQELLTLHYDPVYLQSMRRNFKQYEHSKTVAPEDHSTGAMARLAQEILRGLG